mmetsp:Transcript_13299/g.28745  ORF Transcript_13299/g.28745 Transcript_13299/m.28745 type:complete len:231 (+) Transcript_13299:1149-1841(+)
MRAPQVRDDGDEGYAAPCAAGQASQDLDHDVLGARVQRHDEVRVIPLDGVAEGLLAPHIGEALREPASYRELAREEEDAPHNRKLRHQSVVLHDRVEGPGAVLGEDVPDRDRELVGVLLLQRVSERPGRGSVASTGVRDHQHYALLLQEILRRSLLLECIAVGVLLLGPHLLPDLSLHQRLLVELHGGLICLGVRSWHLGAQSPSKTPPCRHSACEPCHAGHDGGSRRAP